MAAFGPRKLNVNLCQSEAKRTQFMATEGFTDLNVFILKLALERPPSPRRYLLSPLDWI